MENSKESFFSMDRLIEFGMGMAMSRQIANTMNEMMASMRNPPQMQTTVPPLFVQQPIQQGVPMQASYRPFAGGIAPQQISQTPQAVSQVVQGQAGVSAQPVDTQPLPPPLPEVYYISRGNGIQEGPYSDTEITRLVSEKEINAATPIWKAGSPQWQTAKDFPNLLALIALTPPKLLNNDKTISIQEENNESKN